MRSTTACPTPSKEHVIGHDSENPRRQGAELWARRAADELRRISGRRPAGAELTETELRVARLAAEGRANKEIAAAMFMSVHTVEAHLSRVYRKLGLRSRTGLARQAAITAEPEPKP